MESFPGSSTGFLTGHKKSYDYLKIIINKFTKIILLTFSVSAEFPFDNSTSEKVSIKNILIYTTSRYRMTIMDKRNMTGKRYRGTGHQFFPFIFSNIIGIDIFL